MHGTEEKKAENRIQRGEIYFVFLDPCFGREIGGYKARPVVVVSINDIHQNTRLVTVVPGTTSERGDRATNVSVKPDKDNHLREVTAFQCHQIRTIDQGRMTSRPSGMVSRTDSDRIEKAVCLSLGINRGEGEFS